MAWTGNRVRRLTPPMSGPRPLSTKGMDLPRDPGLYIVRSGGCLAHIGTASNLRARVGTLARLGAHGGAVEVLSMAFFTGKLPEVWWHVCSDHPAARELERELKRIHGEPPQPRARFENGVRDLQDRLIYAAGEESWAAGFVTAVFRTGAHVNLLADRKKPDRRLQRVWKSVGIPPSLRPWIGYFDGTDQ